MGASSPGVVTGCRQVSWGRALVGADWQHGPGKCRATGGLVCISGGQSAGTFQWSGTVCLQSSYNEGFQERLHCPWAWLGSQERLANRGCSHWTGPIHSKTAVLCSDQTVTHSLKSPGGEKQIFRDRHPWPCSSVAILVPNTLVFAKAGILPLILLLAAHHGSWSVHGGHGFSCC